MQVLKKNLDFLHTVDIKVKKNHKYFMVGFDPQPSTALSTPNRAN
jgi:hypothetical protein